MPRRAAGMNEKQSVASHLDVLIRALIVDQYSLTTYKRLKGYSSMLDRDADMKARAEMADIISAYIKSPTTTAAVLPFRPAETISSTTKSTADHDEDDSDVDQDYVHVCVTPPKGKPKPTQTTAGRPKNFVTKKYPAVIRSNPDVIYRQTSGSTDEDQKIAVKADNIPAENFWISELVSYDTMSIPIDDRGCSMP